MRPLSLVCVKHEVWPARATGREVCRTRDSRQPLSSGSRTHSPTQLVRTKLEHGPWINPSKGLLLTLVKLQWRKRKREPNPKAPDLREKSFGDPHTFIFWTFLP